MHLPWTNGGARAPLYDGTTTRSRYVVMRDGVRIAVDVTLPNGWRGEQLPTLIRQTRYHRRFRFRPPFHHESVRPFFDQQHEARQYFVRRGYAWVDVCARGSGASGGERPMPWSPDEVEDGRELVDWIVSQEWSNGRVGARGVSYDGTASEFLLLHRHPALRAVAPRFSLFDAFDDIAMPGGIHLEQFTRNWAAFNAALDRNRFDEVIDLVLRLNQAARAQLARSSYASRIDLVSAQAMRFRRPTKRLIGRFVQGVAPVDDDPGGSVLEAHVAQRGQALDVNAVGRAMTYRDEKGLSETYPEVGVDDFSPHSRVDEMRGHAAVYHYSGWFDGAYQRAAIKRFLAHDEEDHRLIIGPWEHGGQQNISPWEASRQPIFDHEGELLRFFDAHLLDDPERLEAYDDEPRVRWFTLGAERWQTADEWPPPGHHGRRWYAVESGRLRPTPDDRGGRDRLSVTGRHGTGEASRWRCLLPLITLTHYEPRSGDDVLVYTSDPLPNDVEVTGHPIVHVEMTSTTSDPRIFAYLEDVARDGTAHYVTEGQLRAIHRRLERDKPASHGPIPFRTYRRADHRDASSGRVLRLEFDLLPTSYLFRAGHSIRFVLAGADADHFQVGPLATHYIERGRTWLELPVRED